MRTVTESITSIVDQHINCPNVCAVAKRFAGDNLEAEIHWITWACEKGRNVLVKWNTIFINNDGKLYNIMQIYRCLQLINPFKVRDINENVRLEIVRTLCLSVPALNGKAG